MTSADYAAQRRDPRWQRKRLEIMERDGFQCRSCKDKYSTLNVHHSYYVKGRMPWDYPPFSMQTLCESCHNNEHDKIGGWSYWEVAINALCKGNPACLEKEVFELSYNIDRLADTGKDHATAFDELLRRLDADYQLWIRAQFPPLPEEQEEVHEEIF